MRRLRISVASWVALLSVLVALVIALLPHEAGAASIGLRIPAPAGTQWKAASGYNTATHLGVDPYALDLVRADGVPTAGTVVLAPISGTLGGGGTSQDCAWIRTSDVTVLICHIITDATPARNATVVQGQRLGVVAPEGQKGNNGLAHIHLAVNRGGSSGTSLPFDGDYLLDGVAFPATTAPNAYSGAPVVTSTNAGQPISVPAISRGRIVSGIVQTDGLSLVMFGGGTNAELVAGAGCGTTSATFWVTINGRFIGYIPAALVPQVNAEWDATFPGGIPANTAMLVRCR